ncbi:MAG: FCD domain-containing protein, partial [Moraxellaceae bacterium]|nr:FCD domain-containing protein [Moraxellaceae bacterium]
VAELSPHMIKGLYEIIVLIFSLIVRKTAEVWRQEDLAPFMNGVNDLQTAVQSRDIESFYNGSFDILRRAQHFTNNPFLDDMLDDLQPSMQRSFYLALQVNRRELDESYAFLKGVLDAVMLRQGERAAELVEEFCLHQRNLVLESLLRAKQIEMAWARRQRR